MLSGKQTTHTAKINFKQNRIKKSNTHFEIIFYAKQQQITVSFLKFEEKKVQTSQNIKY